MVLRETPPVWRQGFDLYRRRTERDTLGRETAHYAQEPDVRVEAADGLAFQHPRSWNSGGNVGAGEEVRAWGEQPGGILEACLRTELNWPPMTGWTSAGGSGRCAPSSAGPAIAS